MYSSFFFFFFACRPLPTKCSFPHHKKFERAKKLWHLAMSHTYAHVQTNMFVNVWACRTPFAPEPYCCLDSDWLRRVWKSTSVELQGGRLLVLPLHTLPLWFSTRSNLWARKRPPCSPHYLSSMAKFWDFLRCHLVCTIAAFDTPPSVSQSLRSSYGET